MHTINDSDVRSALPSSVIVHSGGADLGASTSETAVSAMARIGADTGALLAKIMPDLVLVMGDRLDMLPAATATLPFNLPLAHLHGGEVTEGAIDDRVRHALTQLAHIHCVSTQGARARLMTMGVDDSAIHVTGAPGLDTLKAVSPMSSIEFARAAGLDGIDGDLNALRLVTVHPESNSVDPMAPLDAVLNALEAHPAPTLFTAPNSDPGGAEMRRRIEAFLERHAWARFRDTLGVWLYANALRHAAVMVGNSSSGIIEAGLFGLPVINVGDRQKGRERGGNVIDVQSDGDAICHHLDQLGPAPRRFIFESPYGDGQAGPQIATVLVDALRLQNLTIKRKGVRSGASQLEKNCAI
jgi:UDP-hydrolysing UDP-N-acetyl-D-glucosamine 2-epimerase